MKGNMENNKTFRITYFAKKHGKHITRNAKWTDKCKEFISQKGVACMVYLDLDADGSEQQLENGVLNNGYNLDFNIYRLRNRINSDCILWNNWNLGND